MDQQKFWRLQMFAEGGQAPVSPGEAGAAAGREQGELATPEEGQEDRAMEQDAAATEETTTRLTWEQIKADPEYNREMQAMIQARLKGAKKAREDLELLGPVLEAVAESCGVAAGDYPGLVKAVQARREQTAQEKTQQDSAMAEHYRSL